MARGRHRNVPVRRPLVQPLLGVVVAGTMLGGPLLVAAFPSQPVEPDVPSVPTQAADAEPVALEALRARDDAQASRSRAVATPAVSSAAPSASASPSASPAPSATPEPSATPTPTPTPTAPPEVVGEMWATQAVNVRSEPSAGSERIGYLGGGQSVGVTGETADGWAQVVVDERAGWVNGAYLSDTEPEPEAVAAEAAEEESGSGGVSDAECAKNPEIESGLSSNARAVYRAVCAAYGGSVSSFGGLRPGDDGDHGSGHAVDIMVSGEPGWEIARFLQANAGELGISYLIYEQQYWPAGSPAGAWEWMEDRGGATANHYDHVHVSVH